MENEQNNERISRALEWCRERNIGSKQLNLFDRQYKRKKKNELNEKEFKEMCKKARVDWNALCDTIFTRSILKDPKKEGVNDDNSSS